VYLEQQRMLIKEIKQDIKNLEFSLWDPNEADLYSAMLGLQTGEDVLDSYHYGMAELQKELFAAKEHCRVLSELCVLKKLNTFSKKIAEYL
jgi:hypothetical protein